MLTIADMKRYVVRLPEKVPQRAREASAYLMNEYYLLFFRLGKALLVLYAPDGADLVLSRVLSSHEHLHFCESATIMPTPMQGLKATLRV
jgi:hypothetical protein